MFVDIENDSNHTIYEVGGEKIIITPEDAFGIRQALTQYIQQFSEQLSAYTHTELDEAWIDAQGKVRVGSWIMHEENDSLVLSKRIQMQQRRRIVYCLKARLKRGDNGWFVRRIDVQNIH